MDLDHLCQITNAANHFRVGHRPYIYIMRIYDHYIYIIYHIYFQSFSCFCARGIGKKSIHQRWSHVEVYQLTGGRADGGTEMDPAPGKCPLVAKQLGLWFKGLLEM